MDRLAGFLKSTLSQILKNLQIVIVDQKVQELLELGLRRDPQLRKYLRTYPLRQALSRDKVMELGVAAQPNKLSLFSGREFLPGFIEAFTLTGPA